MTVRYEGIKASTGYAIGNIYLFTREKIEIKKEKSILNSQAMNIKK